MASRPVKNSSRLRQSESSVYAIATRSGSRVFHASSAACTLRRAVSSVNGGTGGRGSTGGKGTPFRRTGGLRSCTGGTTFALVRGAWHGAWCWERLAPELEARGHRVVAPDLPCDDPTATFQTYADVVASGLESAGDDVVLVGHSLAGNTVPLVAAGRPVRRIVYVGALIPIPGHTLNEMMASEPETMVRGHQAGLSRPDEQGRTRWEDFAGARRTFYADCDERDARAAFERLRPQSRAPYDVPCPLEALPPAPRTYVVCTKDAIVDPDNARRVATGRLRGALVELPGSHSPFLSRPAALAEILCAS